MSEDATLAALHPGADFEEAEEILNDEDRDFEELEVEWSSLSRELLLTVERHKGAIRLMVYDMEEMSAAHYLDKREGLQQGGDVYSMERLEGDDWLFSLPIIEDLQNVAARKLRDQAEEMIQKRKEQRKAAKALKEAGESDGEE